MDEPTDTAGPAPRDATNPADAKSPRWHRHPRALWRRSSDRVIVLPPGQSDLLLLEGTGTLIWELLEQPTSEHDLVDLLAGATTADRDVIAPEVAAFLEQLEAEHVIRQP
ncbi:MAG: PqqD family protein [Nitriliruptoraceae bacterium]